MGRMEVLVTKLRKAGIDASLVHRSSIALTDIKIKGSVDIEKVKGDIQALRKVGD